MKKIFIVAALAFPTAACAGGAGGYGDAVRVMKLCTSAAELGQKVFTLRSGPDYPKQRFIEEIKELNEPERNAMIYFRSIDYGYDKATDQKDAYMGGWGICMDLAK